MTPILQDWHYSKYSVSAAAPSVGSLLCCQGEIKLWATISLVSQVDITPVITELKRIYDEDRLRDRTVDHLMDHDVQTWSSLLGISEPCLYNQIAMYLARGFQDLELTFQFCDAVINDLYSVLVFTDERPPNLFWKVFLAFDEGEFYHNKNRDEDPAEAYTRPRIAEMLSQVCDCEGVGERTAICTPLT